MATRSWSNYQKNKKGFLQRKAFKNLCRAPGLEITFRAILK